MLISSDLFFNLNTQLLGIIINKFDVIQVEYKESKPLEHETGRGELMHRITLLFFKTILYKTESLKNFLEQIIKSASIFQPIL